VIEQSHRRRPSQPTQLDFSDKDYGGLMVILKVPLLGADQ